MKHKSRFQLRFFKKPMQTLLLPVVLLSTLASPSQAAWKAHDVSVLFPLPPADKIQNMIGPQDSGNGGSLLPREAYDLFPFLVRFVKPDVLYKEQLKVVALRLDPCFQEGKFTPQTHPEKCRKQVRIVWQPVLPAAMVSTTLDTGLHTFHEFDDTSWAALIHDWKELTKLIDAGPIDGPLDIHPGLKKVGYDSAEWSAFKDTVLRHCGRANLVRIAGMMLNGPLMWVFRTFDLKLETQANGSLGFTVSELEIPRLAGRTPPVAQAFVMDMESLAQLEEFQARVAPAPQDDRDWVSFIADSLGFKVDRQQDLARPARLEDDLKNLAGRALLFENPKLNNPGTLDCVSCHAAQTTRLWTEKNAPLLGFNWDWQNLFKTTRYESSRNLTNLSVNPLQTNRLRAFGYFEDEPQISQRVINETAEVLDTL